MCTVYYTVFHTVSLSADALSIPGGYVVPKGGNITFTCNSTSSSEIILLFWRINLTEMNDIEELVTTVTLNGIVGFNSSDMANANPASFTFRNISFENSPSVVECTDLSLDPNGVSRATIIVEGKSKKFTGMHAKQATLACTMQLVVLIHLSYTCILTKCNLDKKFYYSCTN